MNRFVTGKNSAGFTPISIVVVNTFDELPLSGIAEGDIGLCLNDGLFYQRDVNTNGWTLKFDGLIDGDVAATEVTGLDAFITSSIADELATKADVSHTHAISDITALQAALDAKAASVHTHAAGDVTSGTFAAARLGTGSGGSTKFLREDSTFQTVSAGAAWGAITGTLADQTDLGTALAGKLATGLAELLANKNAALGYAGLDVSSKLTGSQQTYGSAANTACQGNDARLSDSRTPLAHATSHKSGGTDAIKLDELAATTDVVTLNASTTAHGLLPKLDNNAAHWLDGTGAWTAVTAAAAARNPNLRVQEAASYTLAANYSLVIGRKYLIASGQKFIVSSGAALRLL